MGTAQSKPTVIMDARKFVRYINNGAASKLRFFEEAVERMGAQVGKNLRLASLDATSIMFEDVDKNTYYLADVKKANRGRVDVDNIRQIQIIEEEKSNQFNKNCRDLVEAICGGNLKQADRVFTKIEGQRYQSKVIPESGWITLKDGIARRVRASNRIVSDNHIDNIVKLFTESVRDNVEMDRGRIVRGTLSDGTQKFIIPINEYTRRRLVAHKMRSIAEQAYKSDAFKKFVLRIGSLMCEGNVKESCNTAAKFLREEQEFCLLTRNGMRYLVENTLASQGEFNSFLSKDITNVIFRTNLAVNRHAIVESWTKAAQKAQNASLLTNINILSESKNFEDDHNEFLNIVFNEELDIQQARAKAYRTCLKVIAGVIPELEDDDEETTASVDELNELIERLSGAEADTDAILQAEELLANISDSLIDNIQSLEGFDREPGEEGSSGEEEEEGSQLFPMVEVGEEEEEEEGGMPPGEEGEEEGGMPPMPPGPGEELPLAADAEHPGRSKKISDMNLTGLLEHVENWRLNGELYLNKFGYDKCTKQLNNYVKQCMKLGPSTNIIREHFENMRQRMFDTNGHELLEDMDNDPYLNSLTVALNGPNKILHSDNNNDPERDPDFIGRKVSESKLDRDYYQSIIEAEKPYGSARVPSGISDPATDPLRMDDLQGSGIAGKSTQKSDGRSAGGEAGGYQAKQRGSGLAGKGMKPVDGRKGNHSTSGSAGGSLRMDDMQSGGGVQSKGLHSSDGRKGSVGSSETSSESAIPVSGGDPATTKGGYSSVGLSMGKDFQGTGGKGSVTGKSIANTDGVSGDGAKSAKGYEASGGPTAVSIRMDELHGKDGIADETPSGNHPGDTGKVGSDGGTKKISGGGDMGILQGKEGVAEDFSPEHIAELIDLMEQTLCPHGKEACPEDCTCDMTCLCKQAMNEEEEGGGKVPPEFLENIICNDCNNKKKECTCEEPASEAQYKGPSYKKIGYKRSSINPMEDMQQDPSNLVETDDDFGAGSLGDTEVLSDEDIVVIAGKPDKVAKALADILPGLGGGKVPELEPGDITGEEMPDIGEMPESEPEGLEGLEGLEGEADEEADEEVMGAAFEEGEAEEEELED